MDSSRGLRAQNNGFSWVHWKAKGRENRALFLLRTSICLRCGGVAQSGFRLLHESGEALRVVDGDVSENLAIQLDTRFFEAVDELRVADVVQLGGGVDAHDPERAV